MKVLLALLMAVSLMAGHLTTVTGFNLLIGDTDCSKTLTSKDAYHVLEMSAGFSFEDFCITNGDVDLDMRLTSIDAALILQVESCLLQYFPKDFFRSQECG